MNKTIITSIVLLLLSPTISLAKTSVLIEICAVCVSSESFKTRAVSYALPLTERHVILYNLAGDARKYRVYPANADLKPIASEVALTSPESGYFQSAQELREAFGLYLSDDSIKASPPTPFKTGEVADLLDYLPPCAESVFCSSEIDWSVYDFVDNNDLTSELMAKIASMQGFEQSVSDLDGYATLMLETSTASGDALSFPSRIHSTLQLNNGDSAGFQLIPPSSFGDQLTIELRWISVAGRLRGIETMQTELEGDQWFMLNGKSDHIAFIRMLSRIELVSTQLSDSLVNNLNNETVLIDELSLPYGHGAPSSIMTTRLSRIQARKISIEQRR